MRCSGGETASARCRDRFNAFASAIPDDQVSWIRRFWTRVLGVGVIDVEARAVGQNEVDEARLLFGRAFFLLHVLEAARVAQRTFGLVVPAHARGPVRLVGVDEQ